MMKILKKNQYGFSLPLVLGMIAIFAISALFAISRWRDRTSDQLHTVADAQALNIISILRNILQDSTTTTTTTAWQHTVGYAGNTELACLKNGTHCDSYSQANDAPPTGTYPLTATHGNFALLDKSGKIFYDSTSATAGFDTSGNVCNPATTGNYSNTTGNSKCPYHAVLYWYTSCLVSDVPCTKYTIAGYILYNPQQVDSAGKKTMFAVPFNPGLYTFTIGVGAAETCCYIGCTHLTADAGTAYVVLKISDPVVVNYRLGTTANNCYAGSPEVANTICSDTLYSNPHSYDWKPNGDNNIFTGTCN